MDNLFTRLILVATILPVGLGGMTIASDIGTRKQASVPSGLDAPTLWTTEPVRVDPKRQHYERLPAIGVAAAPEAVIQAAKPAEVAKNQAADEGSLNLIASNSADANQAAWCQQRYKSYNPQDNTYQPYGVGARRTCMAPRGQMAVADAMPQPMSQAAGVSGNDHVQWCFNRYSSYRISDNTYQPFSGPRRACLSASNASADRAGANLQASM